MIEIYLWLKYIYDWNIFMIEIYLWLKYIYILGGWKYGEFDEGSVVEGWNNFKLKEWF